jgi:leader peptidase (prepilin peptidase)/N-methyltransferase
MIDLPLFVYFLVSAAFFFGLIVGSFANVVIYRVPLERSIVFPSSSCPKCGASIKPWHNLPVLSWLLLGGRCASCHEPISARYPLVEAIHGLGFALIVFRYGPFPFTLLLLALFSALVILALIDWDHQILPDAITLPGIVAGIAGSFLSGALVDWKESVLAAAFGYVSFFLVAEFYKRVRGIEGLGQGDWKLAAMLGAFFGGHRLLLTVFFGSISGMVYGLVQGFRMRGAQPESIGGPETPVEAPVPVESAPASSISPPVSIGKFKLPFGTFLAASAIFVLFAGDAVLSWYASFFRF